MPKLLREIVPVKEGVLRALGMAAAAAGAGAITGASSLGGAPIGALPGAAIGLGGYLAFGDLKKDLAHTAADDKLPSNSKSRQDIARNKDPKPTAMPALAETAATPGQNQTDQKNADVVDFDRAKKRRAFLTGSATRIRKKFHRSYIGSKKSDKVYGKKINRGTGKVEKGVK